MRHVIDEEGMGKPGKNPKKQPFCLSYEERRNVELSDTPISISELIRRINALIDRDNMSKLNCRCISDWLLELGLLCSDVDEQGKRFRKPTERVRSSA